MTLGDGVSGSLFDIVLRTLGKDLMCFAEKVHNRY